jgi:carbonic anhydrase
MTQDLLRGLSRFRTDYFPSHEEQFRRLVDDGQHPGTLFIGCCDSRVIPDVLTGAEPGDLFVLRNIGNLVPPADQEEGYNGVAAAIDYAVDILKVRDIVICGHSHCGAMRALYEPPEGASSHLVNWLELAAPARLEEPHSQEVQVRTERRSIVLQLERLMDYPNVKRRLKEGSLSLHGWHYVIEEGQVYILDGERGSFEPYEG